MLFLCIQTLATKLSSIDQLLIIVISIFTQHPTNEKMRPWVLAHRTFIKRQSAASFGIFVFKLPYICNSTYQHHSSSSFFFNWCYNPWWVLACFMISFHKPQSLHFSLQFLTFIFFKSSSTCSRHLSLRLPTGLDEHGSHSASFLTVLTVSILITPPFFTPQYLEKQSNQLQKRDGKSDTTEVHTI